MEQHVTDQPTFASQLIAERYQLRSVLAHGSACIVFRGEDTTLRRSVAVKLVPAEHVEVYRAAMRATATIAHPAAVLVLDTVEWDGGYYIVQEFVPGVSLAGQLNRGLSSERAINLGLQLSRLVVYVHRRGVTHGDLTPTSVLIEPVGTARLNNFCLPPDDAYFAQYPTIEAQLAQGLGAGETLTEGPPLELNTPATDVRAIGMLLAQALTTTSPSGKVRTFGADVPADVSELVERLVIRDHPHPLTDLTDLLIRLELAKVALGQRRANDLQETPPAVRRHRDHIQQAAPWSEADTQLNMGQMGQMGQRWSGSPAPGTPPGMRVGGDFYAGGPPNAAPRAPQPPGPFDAPGMPGVPHNGGGIDRQVTVPTPMPAPPSGPSSAQWPRGGAMPPYPANPSGQLYPPGPISAPRASGPSGPLRMPQPSSPSGPLRAPSMSGPLQRAGLSGPMRPPGSSGPLRAPAMSGPLRAPQLSGPLRPPGSSGPLRAPAMSGPLRAPQLSGPLRPPSPLPQRAPMPSGPLRAAPPTAKLRAYGAPSPIQTYRSQSAITWSDEPQVRQWVEGANSRPYGGPSRPMARLGGTGMSMGMGMTTIILIGLVLFAICFVVGYFTPFLIPFH